MLKRKTKKTKSNPINFTNPFFTVGPRTELKSVTSTLPTGVYSVEARDRALDAKRNAQRLRTGALTGEQMRLKTLRLAQNKRKYLNQIRKLVVSQGLSEEMAQRINALTIANRQWNANRANLADLDAQIERDVRAVMPGAVSDAQLRAAIALYKSALENNGFVYGARKKKSPKKIGVFGFGIHPSEVRVPRLYEITKPDGLRDERPFDAKVHEEEAKDRFREDHQEAFRKYLTFLHGTNPSNEVVKEAFPTTAEPLVAVSTPKPNPTVSHMLHTRTPFVVAHW